MERLEDSPIFVRGLSRSGGTLLVTILDAHPEVSMSYELYPNMLDSLVGNSTRVDQFKTMLENAALTHEKYQGELKTLKTFILRCYRSGLDSNDLSMVYDEFSKAVDNPFAQPEDIMQFIAFCARTKMKKEGKSRWGLKCNNTYERYTKAWPEAHYLNIIRDGRDVLASQLNTGSFSKTVSKVAEAYNMTHQIFAFFQEQPNFHGLNVYYEALVTNIQPTLKELCNFVGLEYSQQMENHHNHDLSIFKYSMGHLSKNEISKPMHSNQIGRWKKDLMPHQISEFEEITADLLRNHNYL